MRNNKEEAMKKSMLYTGMAYCIIGLICLMAAVFT